MLSLSSSKNILKPPPVCKKSDKPPLAAAEYPGPVLQAWVWAGDLQVPPEDVITDTMFMERIAEDPDIYNGKITQGEKLILVDMVYDHEEKTYTINVAYVEDDVLIDDATIGPLADQGQRIFTPRPNFVTGRRGRRFFETRIIR